MAIDPEAIQRFLARPAKHVPDVKRMDEQHLYRFIRHNTGLYPEFITEPRPPQLQGLALALDIERALLFYFMRMGKTKLALDWASHLALCGRWKKNKGIVVVPRPVLIDVWQYEAKVHSCLKTVAVAKTSVDAMLDAIESDADLILCSITTLYHMLTIKRHITRGKNKGKPHLYPDYELIDCVAQCLSLAILDEIHLYKNPDGLPFAIMSALVKQCRFRVGLTGTAWGRNPMDIWAQAYLIDNGHTLGYSPRFFSAAFGTPKKNYAINKMVNVFDPKKMPLLQEKLSGISLSYKREDIEGQVQIGLVQLRMHGDQAAAYEKTVKALRDQPKDVDSQFKIKNTFIRLRQIASGFLPFTDDDGEGQVVHFQENAKLAWLTDFMEHLDADVKVIVFYSFTASGQRICEMLDKLKIAHTWLWSGTKNRGETVAAFQRGKARVIVANVASGDVGVDLSAADYQLFYETSMSMPVRVQAEQRAQGAARGTRPLLIDDISCAPIETRILDMTREGKDIMAALFANPRAFAKNLSQNAK